MRVEVISFKDGHDVRLSTGRTGGGKGQFTTRRGAMRLANEFLDFIGQEKVTTRGWDAVKINDGWAFTRR